MNITRKPSAEQMRAALDELKKMGPLDPDVIETFKQIERERRRGNGIDPAEPDIERMKEGFRDGFGSCKDDEDLAAVIDEMEREKAMDVPREPESLDEAP